MNYKTAEREITEAAVASFDGSESDRYRTVMQALVKHLHSFAQEVQLTQAEWMAGIDFLTRAGQISGPRSQELILLSDILGLSMLTVAINEPKDQRVTASTVFGPFFVENSPWIERDGDLAQGAIGEPCYVSGSVSSVDGSPIAGARVEVWGADEDGLYDVQYNTTRIANRGHQHTEDDGTFRFWTVMPVPYPIPTDGPAGELLQTARRTPMRPAHLHFMITAPGYQDLITHIFADGDPHLGSDAVFGVRPSLIGDYASNPAGTAPDGSVREKGWVELKFDFVLGERVEVDG